MHFEKWHGLGNDYLLIERATTGGLLDASLVRRLCDPHRGIGADGVLEVLSSEGPRAEIQIWNPDGSQAELSGNGTRIAARWLARRAGVHDVTLTVGARVMRARLGAGIQVEQDLGAVAVGVSESLEVGGTQIAFTPVDVGNPHAVVEVEPARETLRRLGPLIEQHERFPNRTNVQLMRIDGVHDITVGVWERGAGETLSSGTSATAAAAAAIAGGRCQSPVTVHLPAGELEVTIDASGHARLTGPAQEICSGEVSEELLADVEPD
jgi:diaminopimelate epimerase